MKLPPFLGRLNRKSFGSYAIDDPRPVARDAPYTFFLPSAEQLQAIAPGDEVKVIVRSIPPSNEWQAERMWVKVTAVDGDALAGELDNQPSDIPQLGPGSALSFDRSDVIDIIWGEDRALDPPPPPERREYWDRCMVDSCVVAGRSRVDYLYREEPDLAQPDDKYPDSGWRIRGSDRGVDEDRALGENPQYLALGAVLNRDDSWLSLIDEPVGARFERDRDAKFVRLGNTGQ